jgi:hypothetical protein
MIRDDHKRHIDDHSNDFLTYCWSVHIAHSRCIPYLSLYCLLQLFAACRASAPGLQDTLNVCLAVRSEIHRVF